MIVSLLFIVRIVLAMVLGTAAVAKLRAIDAFRDALTELELPRPAVLAWLVPAVEIAVAIALLLPMLARTASFAAAALFLSFAVVMARAGWRGQRTDCQCFGRLARSISGWGAAVRSLGFTALSLPPALIEPASLGASIGSGPLLALALTAALGGVAWLLVHNARLARRIASLESRITQLTADTRPGDSGVLATVLHTITGEAVTVRQLCEPRRPVLLVFVDTRCRPCENVVKHVAEWTSRVGDALAIVVIARGTPTELAAWQQTYRLERLFEDRSGGLRETVRIRGTPGAVVIDVEGQRPRPPVHGADAIRRLVDDVERRSARAPQPEPSRRRRASSEPSSAESPPLPSIVVGALLPELILPLPDGSDASVCSVGDRPTLVVFWSDDCHQCDELLDALPRVPTDKTGPLSIRLVAVGATRSPRLARLPWPVLHDRDFVSRPTLGVVGTPSAILVGADCTVAAPPAMGAAAVMALTAAARS